MDKKDLEIKVQKTKYLNNSTYLRTKYEKQRR